MKELELHLKDLVSATVAEEWHKGLARDPQLSPSSKKYNLNMQNRAAGFRRQAHRKIVNLFAKESN